MRTDHFVESVFVSTSSVTAVTPSPVSGKVGVRPLPIRHPKRKNYSYKLKFILPKQRSPETLFDESPGIVIFANGFYSFSEFSSFSSASFSVSAASMGLSASTATAAS